MDDGLLSDDLSPPPLKLRERISSLPPQHVLDHQASQGLNLASRRAKSEPTDFEVFPQDGRSSTQYEKDTESPAAIFAKWLKKHLIVGGRRVSVKEREMTSASDDSTNEALIGKANSRIDTLQDRMERARTRIRKLEGEIVEQRKKSRATEQGSEKKLEESETLVRDLESGNIALCKVLCSAQSAVKKTQELTMYAQSQIRVFGVMLREHLIPEECRKERLETLVDNLEEVGRSLQETGELLEEGERYQGTRNDSVVTSRTHHVVRQETQEDGPCSCPDLRCEVERLESELAECLGSKEDLGIKLQEAYGMISELKYDAAKSANRCVALEQGMILLGAKLNARNEDTMVERHKPDGHHSLEQKVSTASIMETEVHQELKGLLHYLKENGCWSDQGKELYDLCDLLSELRSATAASMHKIMVLENHKAEAFEVIGSLRKDFKAACTQLELEVKEGEVLRQDLNRFSNKSRENIVQQGGEEVTSEKRVKHPKEEQVVEEELDSMDARSLGSFIREHAPQQHEHRMGSRARFAHDKKDCTKSSDVSHGAAPREDPYSGQLDSIGRQLKSFSLDQRDLRSELRMLSDLQESYGSQIPDMVGGLHHQIASLQAIVTGMETRGLGSQSWESRFESGFDVNGSQVYHSLQGSGGW